MFFVSRDVQVPGGKIIEQPGAESEALQNDCSQGTNDQPIVFQYNIAVMGTAYSESRSHSGNPVLIDPWYHGYRNTVVGLKT